MTPHGPALVIANPRSGRRRGAALREAVVQLDAAGARHTVVTTQYAGHAVELAERGVTDQGFRFVVAVGGETVQGHHR